MNHVIRSRRFARPSYTLTLVSNRRGFTLYRGELCENYIGHYDTLKESDRHFTFWNDALTWMSSFGQHAE